MREQERWDEHAGFMDSLAGAGFIVLGGPLGGGEEKFLLYHHGSALHTDLALVSCHARNFSGT